MVNHLTNPLRSRPTPLGSLLNAAGQRLAAELDAALRAAGFDDLRAAHAPLFVAIDAGGSRVTELAERSAMSKQAVGELVRHLASRGYVSVDVDPDDRRAKRVTLTERGWRALELGTAVIDEFDAWLATAVGAEQVEALRAALQRVIAAPSRARPRPDVPRPAV